MDMTVTNNENQQVTPELKRLLEPSYDPKYGVPEGVYLIRDMVDPNAENAIRYYERFQDAWDCVENTLYDTVDVSSPKVYDPDNPDASSVFDPKLQKEVNYIYEADYQNLVTGSRTRQRTASVKASPVSGRVTKSVDLTESETSAPKSGGKAKTKRKPKTTKVNEVPGVPELEDDFE